MSSKFHVVVTDYLSDAAPELAILGDVADLTLLQTHDEADVAKVGERADALLVFHDIKLTERSIATLSKCRGIVRCGVGYDNVDLRAAGQRGIVVCNVPDYGTEEVADHALLLLLAIARRLRDSDRSVREGHWSPAIAFGAPRLRGRTLGIIGCGRIGTAMTLRSKALGLRVLVYDPYQAPGLEKALGVERSFSLEAMLPQCHFVSIHCLLTPETRNILDARTLELLPRGAYVVNTARGPCVDLNALYDALETGHIAGAGLDVVEPEPLVDERVRRHPRVLLTPHAAFYSVEGFQEMRSKGALEARRLLLGEPVHNPVNRHCLTNPRGVLANVGEW